MVRTSPERVIRSTVRILRLCGIPSHLDTADTHYCARLMTESQTCNPKENTRPDRRFFTETDSRGSQGTEVTGTVQSSYEV